MDGLKSLNHFTPKEKCSVKYSDLDYAVFTYLDLLQEMIVEEQKLEAGLNDGQIDTSKWHGNKNIRGQWK